MQLKTYNIFMLVATLLAWAGFFLVVRNFDPEQANVVVFIFFYLSFFLSIVGTLTLAGFWLRKIFKRKKELATELIRESFRQALILSSVLVLALLLQAGRLLTWWIILLIVLGATIVEFLFLLWHQESKENL